jgi:hypothetical protein
VPDRQSVKPALALTRRQVRAAHAAGPTVQPTRGACKEEVR